MPLRWLGMAFLVLGLVFAQASADEPAASENKHGEKGHGHKSEGKKSGNDSDKLLEPRLDLTLWTIAVFVLLLLVLRKFAWGPMLKGLQTREDTIRQAVEEAKNARDEAARLRAQFKLEAEQESAKVAKFMDDARRNAEKLVEDMRTKASSEIQAEKLRMRREGDQARDQALQELWDKSAELATVVAGRVLARILSPEDHQRLLHVAVEELQKSDQQEFVNA